MASSINSLYLLTAMTGKTAGSDRTTVIGTVEMKLRTFWIAALALIPGGILAATFYSLLDYYALLLIGVVEIAAFYLIEGRSREGLRLRTYQTMYDKKRSKDNVFYLCGAPLDMSETTFGTIQQISAPVVRDGGTPGSAPNRDFEATVR